MIETFRARNYGCLKDVRASLTQLHAFIGPNDSGKSTLLHGLRTVVQFAGSSFRPEGDGWAPFNPFLPTRYPVYTPRTKPHDVMLACAVAGGWYAIETGLSGLEERIGADIGGSGPSRSFARPWNQPSQFWSSDLPLEQQVIHQIQRTRFLRLDPDALRAPSGLIPETDPVGFLDERGRGLAGVYFAIRNRNDEAFSAIVEQVRRYFPTIKGLRVKAVTAGTVELEAELVSGARVEAARLSEGLLYYLAFAALQHLEPVSLLLIEEPENGLHPARVAEVTRILREISKSVQVVVATHSPLLVNELRPEEVSVVTRKEETGTRVARIHETPDFAERSKIYALGELWIAYANGEDEGPLLEGREP
jgi:energy-coupling factor transporter ATP-binding protein EcfA2